MTFPTGSSDMRIPAQSSSRLARFGWLLPISIALMVYSVSLGNYFAYDDFIWLNRARTFASDWRQIFRPDVIYFDPLVHLMFLVDSRIGGLDPRWYHCVDLFIHAVNSVLVYRFARLLSGNEKAALYVSILFASSFAVVDAVVWPSSRVDLVSTLFALDTLIHFLRYLRSDCRRNLLVSLGLFVLALGAKGTPLVLPLVLFWLLIQEQKPLRRATCLFPFGLVIILYGALVMLTRNQAALPLDRLHCNIGNLALAFCSLFVPEELLSRFNIAAAAAMLVPAVSALALLPLHRDATARLRRTGFCLLLAAILPVLILTDFKLSAKATASYLVLLSPSHRIYLASAGAALLCGGVLEQLGTFLGRFSSRITAAAVGMILVGIVICNAFLVRERNNVWESVGEGYKSAAIGLRSYRGTVAEGSQIGLINFTGSRGFLTPLLSLSLGIDNMSIIKEVIIGTIDDPQILDKAGESHLFVIGADRRVYDKSELFRKQLILNRLALQNPNRPEYERDCLKVAKQLDQELAALFPNDHQ
jgi:hypothetical protein